MKEDIYQNCDKDSILIWIDTNIHNNQNTQYTKEIHKFKFLKIKVFENIKEAINYIKEIKFESTKIIISGELYSEFLNSLKEVIRDIFVAPKIIVFTNNKEKFYMLNKDYHNKENIFYTYGGVVTTFQEITKFLIDEIKPRKLEKNNSIKFLKNENLQNNFIKSDGSEYIFEYIDCKEKLIYPLLYKSLLENISLDNLENYTALLFSTYSKNNLDIKRLLGQIESMQNIPIEILSKYFARLLSIDSEFHEDINKDLRLGKSEKHLLYIKVLYEGLRLRSLRFSNINILYRSSKISFDDFNKMKKYLSNKIEGLPGAIVFAKQFLTFSKDRRIVEQYLNMEKNDKNFIKAFFILDMDINIDYDLNTHCDLESISVYPLEKEVLFFPFSAFEIKELKEISINNEKCYQIKLLYLGKYLKELNNNKKDENIIPDSEFKNQLLEFGLLGKDTK